MSAVVFVSMTELGAIVSAQKAKDPQLAPRSMGLAARRGEKVCRYEGPDALSLLQRLPAPPRPDKLLPLPMVAAEKRVLQAVFTEPGATAEDCVRMTEEPACVVAATFRRMHARGEAVVDQDGRCWPVSGTEAPEVSLRRERRRPSLEALRTIEQTKGRPRGPWDL